MTLISAHRMTEDVLWEMFQYISTVNMHIYTQMHTRTHTLDTGLYMEVLMTLGD